MAVDKKFEIVKHEGYRFIGKTVYARAFGKSEKVFDALWGYDDWLFGNLDNMKEHATEEIHNATLMTWDKYDDKNCLLGYTRGRFMKSDAPVPSDMDYIDIPEGYIAKWAGSCDGYPEMYVRDKVAQTGEYEPATHIFMGELFPKDENGNMLFEFFLACTKKG